MFSWKKANRDDKSDVTTKLHDDVSKQDDDSVAAVIDTGKLERAIAPASHIDSNTVIIGNVETEGALNLFGRICYL